MVKRVIYPPFWLIFALVAVFCCDRYWPLMRFGSVYFQYLGGAVICAGLFLLITAGGLFKRAGTDLVPFGNVTALVTTGVYRYSRNPMYLGLLLVLMGTVLTVGVISGFIVCLVFVAVIHWRFVLPEEALLRERFGDEYEAYCRRVRRWI